MLVAPEKKFLIFVGHAEAFAIYRELKGTRARRPLPHDLVANVIRGFDIEVRSVVISSIVDSTFCATLHLRQQSGATASRHELRLDLRASDAMIIALKTGQSLFTTSAVLEKVEDVTELLGTPGEESGGPEALEGGLDA